MVNYPGFLSPDLKILNDSWTIDFRSKKDPKPDTTDWSFLDFRSQIEAEEDAREDLRDYGEYVTVTTQLPASIEKQFARRLLRPPAPYLIPQHPGDPITLRRYGPLSASQVPLTSDVTDYCRELARAYHTRHSYPWKAPFEFNKIRSGASYHYPGIH